MLQLEARSYASRNQLAVSQKQIDAAFELEWDRHYITVLGVANKRLYEFRLQTAKDTYDKAKVGRFSTSTQHRLSLAKLYRPMFAEGTLHMPSIPATFPG